MILKIKEPLSKYSLHTFLLPVFFVLHNYIQYYGLISVGMCLKTLAEIELVFLLFFLLVFFAISNIKKALQITTVVGLVALFFGVAKDFLSLTLKLNFFTKYTVLLPVTAAIVFVLIFLIFKKRSFSKSTLFQNLLLLTFIFVDGITLIFSGNSFFIERNLLVKKNILNTDKLAPVAEKPDVYFLVFDSYPSTNFLRDIMHYDNTEFDSSLQSKGFDVLNNPKSNYNRTAFSIASALNFEYLKNITNYKPIQPKDYNQAKLSIELATVPKVFLHYGYSIYNLSVFDIAGEKAIYKEDFFTLPEQQVLLYNTLYERIKKDILWNLFAGKYSLKSLSAINKLKQDEIINALLEKKDFTNKIIDSVQKIPMQNTGAPKFVYAHFYLPHPPFFYTEEGKENDMNYASTNASTSDQPLLISYIKYTNKKIIGIVDTILKKSAKPPVIIIQSDHGYRDLKGEEKTSNLHFENYSAFYFPDKNYSSLYNTISNVNTFPIIFNKYFNTTIPMQKDTSVFLAY